MLGGVRGRGRRRREERKRRKRKGGPQPSKYYVRKGEGKGGEKEERRGEKEKKSLVFFRRLNSATLALMNMRSRHIWMPPKGKERNKNEKVNLRKGV